MTVLASEVRAGAYYDSVVLMQLQTRARRRNRGSPRPESSWPRKTNQEHARGRVGCWLVRRQRRAAGNDLLAVAVASGVTGGSRRARPSGGFDELIRRGAVAGAVVEYRPKRPRRSGSAHAPPSAPGSLVSVPGRLCVARCRPTRRLGQELQRVSLQRQCPPRGRERTSNAEAGSARACFLLGPDCGTAVIGGIGLGFANRVRSGTGRPDRPPPGPVCSRSLQRPPPVSEAGITQAIGTGGRDLSRGGRRRDRRLPRRSTFWRPGSRRRSVVVLISKPPAPGASQRARLLAEAARLDRQTGGAALSRATRRPRAASVGPVHFADRPRGCCSAIGA